MGLFNFKKDKKGIPDMIDLKKVLDAEELVLLRTDLWAVGEKMPSSKSVIDTVTQMIDRNGKIPKQVLDLCIVSVQEMLDSTAAFFGIRLGGNAAMLEKLKALKEDG